MGDLLPYDESRTLPEMLSRIHGTINNYARSLNYMHEMMDFVENHSHILIILDGGTSGQQIKDADSQLMLERQMLSGHDELKGFTSLSRE